MIVGSLYIFIYNVLLLQRNKMYTRDQDREPDSQGRVRVQLKNDDGTPKNAEYPTSKFYANLFHSYIDVPDLLSSKYFYGWNSRSFPSFCALPDAHAQL